MSINPETLSAIDATPAAVATPNRRVLGRTTVLIAAGALTISGCSWLGGGDGEGSEDPEGLSIPTNEIAVLCDNDPFALGAYQEAVGQGPAADNEAARADTPLDADIKMEAVIDMGMGNAFLASLYRATEIQDSASYNPQSILEETERIFAENYDDPEQFRADCEAAAQDLLNEGMGDIEPLNAEQLVAFTNRYDDDGNLVGLEIIEGVLTQDTVKVLGFRDDNDNMLAGIVVSDDARNGQWVMIDNREAAEITDEDSDAKATIADDELNLTVDTTLADADTTSETDTDADGDDDEAGPDDGQPNDNGCDGEGQPACEGGDEPGEPTPASTTSAPTTTAAPAPTTTSAPTTAPPPTAPPTTSPPSTAPPTTPPPPPPPSTTTTTTEPKGPEPTVPPDCNENPHDPRC